AHKDETLLAVREAGDDSYLYEVSYLLCVSQDKLPAGRWAADRPAATVTINTPAGGSSSPHAGCSSPTSLCPEAWPYPAVPQWAPVATWPRGGRAGAVCRPSRAGYAWQRAPARALCCRGVADRRGSGRPRPARESGVSH